MSTEIEETDTGGGLFFTLADEWDTPDIPVEWVVDKFLAKGQIHNLVGAGAGGKSWVSYHCAMTVAERGGKVLIIDEENGRKRIIKRFRQLGISKAAIANIRISSMQGIRWVGDVNDTLTIYNEVSRLGAELVIIDSATRAYSESNLSEDSSTDTSKLYKAWRGIAEDHNTAFLIIDHVTKDNRGRYARGSGDKFNATDYQYNVKSSELAKGIEGYVTLEIAKDRDSDVGRPGDEIFIRVFDDAEGFVCVEFAGSWVDKMVAKASATDDAKGAIRVATMQMLTQFGPMSTADLEKAVTGNATQKREVREQMLIDGAIHSYKDGRKIIYALTEPTGKVPTLRDIYNLRDDE